MSKGVNKLPGNKKYDARKSGERITFNVREDIASLNADKEIKKGWKEKSELPHAKALRLPASLTMLNFT